MTPIPVIHLQHYGRVYPSAWEQADRFRAMKGGELGDWPDWCFLPLAAAYAIAFSKAMRQNLIPRDNALPPGLAADVGNLGALVAWRQTQGIYRFDPEVYDALWQTPLTGSVPVEALYQMPEWCVWIDTDPKSDALGSPGFFAYLEYDARTRRPELRLALSLPGGQAGYSLMGQILHLTECSVADCLVAAYREGERQAQAHGEQLNLDAAAVREAAQAFTALIGPRLSLLLYLCTVNSEIADERTGLKRPANSQPVKTRHGNKLFAASTPTTWGVGVRLGAALRRAREQELATPGTGTHASPRGHIRTAHWHTYWTGPKSGERTPVLKWLPPIPVNIDLSEGVVPVVRPVQR